ncbi:MAG: GNAT family N-acetyltransferase [Vampirovibrio sp.]
MTEDEQPLSKALNPFKKPRFQARLLTDRLYLRLLEAGDANALYTLLQNTTILEAVAFLPNPYTFEDAMAWIQRAQTGFDTNQELLVGIFTQKEGVFIGNAGLHLQQDNDSAEIGYWLDEAHWEKGYATEVTQALIQYAFSELKLAMVFATTAEGNKASQRILEKCGLTWTQTIDRKTESGQIRPSYYFQAYQAKQAPES